MVVLPRTGLVPSDLSHPGPDFPQPVPRPPLSLHSTSNRCPAMDQSVDKWHSIRPWIHRFALSVDQVSSVSATFTLKSSLAPKPLDPALESLLEDERDESSCAPTEHSDPSTRSRVVSDALTQGLSVKVNSSPWQRVLLRVDEETDEAIIIVFGLMPGRQYDVQLGINHRQELRSQIFTNGNDACAFFLPSQFLPSNT